MEQLLALAGALIVILLGIIGFWIQKWIKSTDALTLAISDLRVLIATTQGSVDSLKQNCTSRCKVVDSRLNSHSKAIQDHSLDIALIKQALHHESE
ncbi:MAG: hypothetical protein R6V75_03300 [Bacteroidales bacterium]